MNIPAFVVRSVQATRRVVQGAHRSLQPAEYTLIELVTGKWRSFALEAITRLGVADALFERPRDVAELARELRLDEDALHRVLRALASDGLLTQRGRTFGLTTITRPLCARAPNTMRHAVLSAGSAHHRSLWNHIERGVAPASTPLFEQLHGTTFWAYLAAHPAEAAEFDASMAEYTREAAGLIARSYDLARFESLVDLGGGRGEMLAAVLERHPTLRGVDFDLPHAVRGAREFFASRGIEDRVTIVAGDMLESVPSGHDAYLLKNVLHDMPDALARATLARIRSAMRDSARVLIVENVVPPDGGPYLAYLDLVMLLGSGGRERTAAEFRALLADEGFVLEAIVPNASPLSLLVARAAQ